MAHIITRRSFLKSGAKAAAAAGLASLVNIPPFLRRALAEGNIGISGKKLLFIFLRGGNDGVNNIIPIQDPAYSVGRPAPVPGDLGHIGFPKDPGTNYADPTGRCDTPGLGYPYPIRLGNGFAALNPALADLAPLYNTGKLALIHRVGYRTQSRSHFDSEVYWEKGTNGTSENRGVQDGLWYRTIVESGWNRNHALAGVSIQSNMPQSLRGVEPMTNLSSIGRYNLLGVSAPSGSVNTDRVKLLNAIDAAMQSPTPTKDNRELVKGLGVAFRDTLDTFQDPAFATNNFKDTDGTFLFPSQNSEDLLNRFGGSFGFIQSVKSAAQILANTDAIIAGTEMGGFDTHTAQVTLGSPHLGGHANLLKRIAWAYYALSKFFSNSAYNNRGPNGVGKDMWSDVVVVTMSEFGRTSAENASVGTDHGEASVMYVAGGGVTGGVYGCDPGLTNGVQNWTPGDLGVNNGKSGSLYSANNTVGYLRRVIDYRSVMGEIIRDHLGAMPNQLNHIIPSYANEAAEHLKSGGSVSTTPIIGELGLV